MAGLDIRNSGWVLESSEAQIGGSVCPGNPGLEESGIPDLISAPVKSGLGPCHTMHLGTVLNHVDGLHVDIIASRPSAQQDSPEVHLDMVVQGTMVGGDVFAERTVGNIYLHLGRNAVHVVCFLDSNACCRSRTDNIVQSDVLLFSILVVVAVDLLIKAVHQHANYKSRGGPLCGGHPVYFRKSGLYEGLCLLEALFRVFGEFSNPRQQPLHGHEVSSVIVFLTHVISFFFQFVFQELAMVCAIYGVQEFLRNCFSVIPD